MENLSDCQVYWLWLHQRAKKALGVKIISGISGIKSESVKASKHWLIPHKSKKVKVKGSP